MADGRIEKQDIFAPDVEKAIQDVTLELKKLTDQLTKAAKAATEYKADTDDVAKAEQQLAQQELQNNKIRNELLKTEQEYQKLQEKKLKQQEQESKNTVEYSANAARANKLKKDEIELAKAQIILNDKNAGTIEKQKAELTKLRIEKERLIKTDANYSESVKKIIARQNELSKQLNKTNYDTQRAFWAFGNIKRGLEGLPGPLGAASNGILSLGKELWAIVANPIGLVIASIVSGLALLYKSFTSTDAGATKFAATMKAMGNVLDVVLDRVYNFGGAIKALFTNDAKAFGENMKAAFDGVGKSITEAAKAGWDYAMAMDAIEDRESAAQIRTAQLKVDIAELTNLSKNRTKTDSERLAAAELAMEKSIELNKIEKGFLKERYDAELNNLASKIQADNLSAQSKRDYLSKWLTYTDLEIEKEKEKDKLFADFANKNEDGLKNLQKLKSDQILKDVEFAQETRKLQSSISGFQDDLRKENADKEKQAIEDSIKFYTGKIKEQGENIRKSYKDREALIEATYQLEILNAKGAAGAVQLAEGNKAEAYRKLNDDLQKYNKQEVTALQTISNAYVSSGQIKIQTDVKVTDEHRKSLERGEKAEEDSLEKRLTRYKEYLTEVQKATSQLADIGMMFLENQRIEEENLLEKKLEAIDLETEQRLTANGLQEASNVMKLQSELAELMAAKASETDIDKQAELTKSINAKQAELAKTKIVEDAEKRKQDLRRESAIKTAEIERKQAILQKTVAVFDIALKTAQSIMTGYAELGLIGGTIAAVVLGALGAAQGIAVAAQPLPEVPSYKVGTKDHKGGAAVLHGQELVELPSGEKFITRGGINDPTLFDLPKHSKVTPADITNQILKEQVMMLNLDSKNSKESLLLQSIDKRLKNLKQVNVNIDKNGFRIAAKQGASKTLHMNNKYRC